MMFKLFLEFFKIGLFTIGGGHAMIPLIKQVVVENGWASVSEIIDFIAISESTPGPFAINIATFMGFKHGGFLYAAMATLGVVLPSFIIIIIIARYFYKFKDNEKVAKVFTGLRPAVIGLILSATVFIARNAFIIENKFDIRSLIIFLIAGSFSLKFKKIHPIFIIIIGAFLGVIFFGNIIPFTL